MSVIICTYTERRWEGLLEAIASLGRQTHAASETIVVIDHDPALLERARRRLPGIRVIQSAGEPGLSGARNTGVAAARGEIVAFLDDDAVADERWLAALAGAFADPDVVGAGGVARPRWQDGVAPRWLPEEFYWTIGCSYRGLPTQIAPIRNPIGATMSFRRAVFEGIDGFTDGIGRVGATPLGCEETELSIRARQAHPGAVVLHVPEAVVEHAVPPERLSWRYFCKRCWAEGLSKALVSREVGSTDALSSEWTYTLRTLPAGVARGLFDAGRGDLAGLQRAGAIVARPAAHRGGLPTRPAGAGAMRSASGRIPVPILLYHSISDRPAAGQPAFTVTPAAFAEHVRAICDSGRTAITVGEFASALRGERELPARPVLITFDDGFADTRAAVELVLEAGLAASVFVTSGWIGRREMLTERGVRELAALGDRIELGAHSVTHPRLDELEPRRAARRFGDSKAALEDLVQAPLRSFAYPHGAYDGHVRAAVIDAGFAGAAARQERASRTPATIRTPSRASPSPRRPTFVRWSGCSPDRAPLSPGGASGCGRAGTGRSDGCAGGGG